MEIKTDPHNSNRVDLCSINFDPIYVQQNQPKQGSFEVKGVRKYVWLLGALLSWIGWATKIQVTANKVVYVNRNSFFTHLAESWAKLQKNTKYQYLHMDRKATLLKMNGNLDFTKRVLNEEEIGLMFRHLGEHRHYQTK